MAATLMAGARNGDVSEATKYVVAYAKIVEDKKEGVFMQGVYFGGLGDTKQEAERIARECTNSGRGNTTIVPKLFESLSGESIISALNKAKAQFSRMEYDMLQAEEIYERSRK